MTRRESDACESARAVLRIGDEGGYRTTSGTWVDLGAAQAAAEAGTRLYAPEVLDDLRSRPAVGGCPPAVEVRDATTQAAAAGLAADGSVCLLNFASARNVGGGFLGGAKAQEEDLCRSSGLYRTLRSQSRYYAANRAHPSTCYTDHVIHSPQVPFFRVEGDGPLLEAPFLASVITAPAPNAGALGRRGPAVDDELQRTFARRWANVLAVAEDQGQRALVLGAWGCGAFRNDPQVVARAARAVLTSPRFAGSFDLVVFAIPDRGRQGSANLATFRAVFRGNRDGTPAPPIARA